MYYKELNDLVEELNKNNVEELKPKLKKYVTQIILSMENDKLNEEDLNGMLKVALVREKIHREIEEQCNKNIGLLIDKFLVKYNSFIKLALNKGMLQEAVTITKEIMKGLGCIHREVLVIRNNNKTGYIEEDKYIYSEKYLNDLISQIKLELDNYKKNQSMEYLIVKGIVNLIDFKMSENLKDIWEEINF